MRMSLILIMLPPLNEYLTGALGPALKTLSLPKFLREMRAFFVA